jgi:hypothetical protein
MQINDVGSIVADLPAANKGTDLPAELAELQTKAQAAEIEALARWTFDDRKASMDDSVVVYDAKCRASRWSNHQRRKFRKIAYTFGYVVDYSTHSKDASWKWLTAKYRELHHERIGESTLRRLAKEMAQLGLLDITENFQEPHGNGCVCVMCDYPGTQRWNTYTIHVGLAVGNNGELAVHDWNAPLADVQERVLVDCQQCGKGFDPKRPDARCCSPRCRKAASRARDVTDNEHQGEHLPEHLGEHPIQFPNGSENTSSSSPRGGVSDDAPADPGDLGEELPSSPSAQGAAALLPGPLAGTAQASPGCRVSFFSEDQHLQLRTYMPELNVRAFARRAQGLGLAADEVWGILMDFAQGRLAGYDPGRLGPGGLMDCLPEMAEAHQHRLAAEAARAAEAQAQAEEQAKVYRVRQEKTELLLGLGNELAVLEGRQPGDNDERLLKKAAERGPDRAIQSTRLEIAARKEENHRREHPDHYTSCGRCRNCTGRRGPSWCNRKMHRQDVACGHDLGEGVEVNGDGISYDDGTGRAYTSLRDW